jgi:hypothetical protein
VIAARLLARDGVAGKRSHKHRDNETRQTAARTSLGHTARHADQATKLFTPAGIVYKEINLAVNLQGGCMRNSR